MMTMRTIVIVVIGFCAALAVNLLLLPGGHLISSLYLIPVLVACHRWRPPAVAVAASVAALLYVVSAIHEGRPLTVWPFGVLAFAIGGYLTIQFSKQREEIAHHGRRESDERRRLQMFIGMVAHELAGAMTNVMAGVEMLDRHRLRTASEAEGVAFAAIDGGTRQMQRLLDDLRDAAAIGTGQFRVRLAAMDLIALVREVVERQQVNNPRHRLVLDAPDQLYVVWDWLRIDQLLTNLVSNACKYSPNGGDVRIVVRAIFGSTTLIVHDQGIGIDEADRQLIFEPFARVQQRDDVPGTGLGLWIAKAIVEAHGGHLSVESEKGHGSAFTATLPLGNVTPFRANVSQPAPNESERAVRALLAAESGVAGFGRASG
jgi:signal transduction histidine kinase